MNDDILKKLETRVNRRGFLRGSSLAVASLVGVAALPLVLSAQQSAGQGSQDQQAQDQDQKGQKQGDGANGKDKDAGKSGDGNSDGKSDTAREDPNKLTMKDDSGREYRICPQCGGTMYRQDDTWTCESCGYSYTE